MDEILAPDILEKTNDRTSLQGSVHAKQHSENIKAVIEAFTNAVPAAIATDIESAITVSRRHGAATAAHS